MLCLNPIYNFKNYEKVWNWVWVGGGDSVIEYLSAKQEKRKGYLPENVENLSATCEFNITCEYSLTLYASNYSEQRFNFDF